MRRCTRWVVAILLAGMLGSCQPTTTPHTTAQMWATHQVIVRLSVTLATRELLRDQPLLRPQVAQWATAASVAVQTVDVTGLRPALIATFPVEWNPDTRYWVEALLDAVLSEVTRALQGVAAPSDVRTIVGQVLSWIGEAAVF